MTTSFFSCSDLKLLGANYLTPSLSVACFLLNLVCFLVFTRSTLAAYTRSNIFKFLKSKSMLDVLESTTRLVKLIYNYPSVKLTLTASILRIVVGDYLKSTISMLSILTELGADFNRLLEMRNSTSGWRRIQNFPLQFGTMIMVTSLVYVYSLFEKTILIEIDDSNSTIYKTQNGEFGNTTTYKLLKFVNGIIRDIVCVLVLILIDCLILVEFRRVIRRKKKILSANNSGEAGSISRVEMAERRLTEMILVKSAVRVCGHVPHFLKYVPSVEINVCFREMSSMFFIFSDAVNFFIYYAYNRVFRAYINGICTSPPGQRITYSTVRRRSKKHHKKSSNKCQDFVVRL